MFAGPKEMVTKILNDAVVRHNAVHVRSMDQIMYRPTGSHVGPLFEDASEQALRLKDVSAQSNTYYHV